MYEIDLKSIRKNNSFSYIFFITSLFIFLMFFVVLEMFAPDRKKNLDSYVIAHSIEVNESHYSDETNYNSIYHYRVNGTEYICASHLTTDFYPNEKNRKVYYNSSNPQECLTDDETNNNKFIFLFLLIPIVFMIISIIPIIKLEKRINKIKKLNNSGISKKRLPYKLVASNIIVNKEYLKKISVNYKLPSGDEIILYGEPINDYLPHEETGEADVLIDDNNPGIYFVDFEIKKKN